MVEVQYLRTTITEEQQQEFGRLVEDTVARIESAQFLPHSGSPISPEPMHQLLLHRLMPGKKRNH